MMIIIIIGRRFPCLDYAQCSPKICFFFFSFLNILIFAVTEQFFFFFAGILTTKVLVLVEFLSFFFLIYQCQYLCNQSRKEESHSTNLRSDFFQLQELAGGAI